MRLFFEERLPHTRHNIILPSPTPLLVFGHISSSAALWEADLSWPLSLARDAEAKLLTSLGGDKAGWHRNTSHAAASVEIIKLMTSAYIMTVPVLPVAGTAGGNGKEIEEPLELFGQMFAEKGFNGEAITADQRGMVSLTCGRKGSRGRHCGLCVYRMECTSETLDCL
ncbi:hypothetical protein WMY93_010658 [Mugilogobius chulae]|uniref:Uncharacterized protein n=1 Tax=Mugilogobius chulae TaxID=88201 RepID=A0AAW0PID7_9GOBI